MVGVFGGHPHPQRIQDTLNVVKAERGHGQFLSHSQSLREGGREREEGKRKEKDDGREEKGSNGEMRREQEEERKKRGE